MSKSYGNTINLSDTPDEIMAKVKNMITDPSRLRLKDVGHPDVCNVFSYYNAFLPEKCSEVRIWCEGATKGCTDCKKILGEGIVEYLRPIREKREKILADRGYIETVLKKGAGQAREIAAQTMKDVRQVIFG